MENIEEFKKRIRESIVGGMSHTYGGVGTVQEKTDVKVDQLAGAVIAAGPQKAGDAIAKMDPNSFAEFAKKIDAAGLAMLTQQFANGVGTAPAADPAAGADPNAAPAADTAGGAPAPTEPELTDL
jgi:hypothetical protein